jgi:hypothetical protein
MPTTKSFSRASKIRLRNYRVRRISWMRGWLLVS